MGIGGVTASASPVVAGGSAGGIDGVPPGACGGDIDIATIIGGV